MKFLIAGTGSIGQRHIRNLCQLRPDVEFVFLRKNGFADELSIKLNACVVPTFNRALDHAPDALVIATPSALHSELLLPAIKSGLPVYVEKPVVTCREKIEAVELAVTASSHVATNLVGCNLRFLPSLQRMYAELRDGSIGRIVRGSFEAGQWLPDWRPGKDHRLTYSADPGKGGGVIMDLIHELDSARWLCGEIGDVKAFSAQVSTLEITTECVVGAVMRSDSGTLINLGLDYVARQPLRRYQLIGEEGTLIWDLSDKTLIRHTPNHKEILESGENSFDISQTYVTAMAEFLASIESGRPTSQPLQEGLRSCELAIRIKEQICQAS